MALDFYLLFGSTTLREPVQSCPGRELRLFACQKTLSRALVWIIEYSIDDRAQLFLTHRI